MRLAVSDDINVVKNSICQVCHEAHKLRQWNKIQEVPEKTLATLMTTLHKLIDDAVPGNDTGLSDEDETVEVMVKCASEAACVALLVMSSENIPRKVGRTTFLFLLLAAGHGGHLGFDRPSPSSSVEVL